MNGRIGDRAVDAVATALAENAEVQGLRRRAFFLLDELADAGFVLVERPAPGDWVVVTWPEVEHYMEIDSCLDEGTWTAYCTCGEYESPTTELRHQAMTAWDAHKTTATAPTVMVKSPTIYVSAIGLPSTGDQP